MSGGVDSAVAALLERERGAEVVGVTLKLWADPRPTAPRRAARRRRCSAPAPLAHSLGDPAPHARPRGGVPPPRRRRTSSTATRDGSDPQPLHRLQRRGADRGDGRPRRAARRDPPGHRPLRAHRRGRRRAAAGRRRRRQARTRATCWRRCRRSCCGSVRFPLTELTKPEVREIAARHGLAGRPQAREPGPLLPRRPGQGRLPAPPRRPARARGRRRRPLAAARSAATAATTTSPSASAAGSASRPRSRSTCSPPTPSPTRSRSAPAGS